MKRFAQKLTKENKAPKNRTKTWSCLRNIFLIICFLPLFYFCADVLNKSGKVSIIIPVYNVEKYIGECLDSVINQTYKNLEIICVDDCGTDNSVKIVEEYSQKDKRIKIVHHNRNKGLAITRNTGVQNSNGEYIFFLDSDDYLNLDIIELLVERQKKTNADVVVSSFRNFAREKIPNINSILKNRNFFKFIPRERCQIDFDNFQNNLNSIFYVVWGKLFKKDFLIKNNIWHINQNICAEDNGFCLKVLSNFPLVSFLKNVGVNYRINPSSITLNLTFLKQRTDTETMLKDFFQYLDQQFEKDKAEKLKELTINSPIYNSFFKSAILHTLIYRPTRILGFWA